MTQLTWLITGCSSGFGLEFVHQVLSRGDKVIATARTLAKIQDLETAGAAILELDVTATQPAIDEVITKAISIYGQVDVIVNNAGFVTAGGWEDLSHQDFLATFETNTFGPIKVTRAILPHFRQRKSGVMVFVSSLSGWVGHGYTGAYAASKFALEGAVESLYKETEPLGLRTLLVEPGRFRTKLLSESNLKAKKSQVTEYASASETHMNFLSAADFTQPGNPEKFVRLVLDLVRVEGVAEGRTIPFRLPVGTDSYEEIRAKIQDVEKLLEEWQPIITSTDY